MDRVSDTGGRESVVCGEGENSRATLLFLSSNCLVMEPLRGGREVRIQCGELTRTHGPHLRALYR